MSLQVFNALPLYRALPPGPREYWLQLEEMKKAAPATQSWMWSSDPFEAAAKREEEKRAREAAAAAVSSSGSGSGGMVINGTRNGGAGAADHKRPLNKAWAEAREVRMAPALREMTEATIRRLMAVFPEAAQPAAVEGDSEADAAGAESVDRARLEKELANLGFRRGHIRSAVEWLCRARESLAQGTAAVDDPLLGALTTMADREAALEYLVLYCPEDDLPVSFRPSAASNPFVTAAGVTGVGVDGLAESWSIDRLVKVAGFPRIAVQEVMQSLADIPREQREGVALDILSRKLVGWDTQEEGRDVWGTSAVMLSVDMLASEDQEVQDERTQKREDERQAVEAVLGDGRVQTVPERERAYAQDFDILISPPADASSADEVRLRVSFHPRSSYPSACSLDTGLDMEAAALPTFYVASSTLPAYLRLALTAHVLRAFRDPEHADWRDMLEAGEGGVLLALVEELESVWAQLVHEPPMVSDIMQHIAPRKPVSQPTQNSTPTNSAQNRPKGAADRSRRRAALKRDAAADSSLLEAQRALHDSSSYQPFKRVRESLPAWGTREDILALLAKQRIIVVTGETGSGKTTQVPQFVLDQAIAEGRGSEINIVVTQPRRVSAMGVAARVAAERCENLEANAGKASSGGAQGLIGYAIRGERRASKNCRCAPIWCSFDQFGVRR